MWLSWLLNLRQNANTLLSPSYKVFEQVPGLTEDFPVAFSTSLDGTLFIIGSQLKVRRRETLILLLFFIGEVEEVVFSVLFFICSNLTDRWMFSQLFQLFNYYQQHIITEYMGEAHWALLSMKHSKSQSFRCWLFSWLILIKTGSSRNQMINTFFFKFCIVSWCTMIQYVYYGDIFILFFCLWLYQFGMFFCFF